MTYCDDWPQIRQRYEAFWHGEIIDRPIVQVTAPAENAPATDPDDAVPSDADDLLDWFTNPERVIPRLERQVARTHYAGDAFPLVFPVSGSLVAIQAAYLGGDYSVRSGTGWCHPIIEDWERCRALVIDPENEWWRMSQRLLADGAKTMAGRAAVGIPDLQGGAQILDLLRGTESLAIDLLENPEFVRQALEEVDASWRQYWRACNDLILPYQEGYVDWLRVWSDTSAVTVECDFSIMVSPSMFDDLLLPSLERQTQMVGRTIYHLDGEGAIRHLDTLLALDTLDGIQWVPGAGARSMCEWIPLLRRIQEGGKLVVASCTPSEVETILSALRPEGVLLSTQCGNAGNALALVEQIS